MRAKFWSSVTATMLLLAEPRLLAHAGPPYPIVVDRKMPSLLLKVSIWGDPDVGIGTFFIVPEMDNGQGLPDDLMFEAVVNKRDQGGDGQLFVAKRQPLRHRVQFFLETEFPTEGPWDVHFIGRTQTTRAEFDAQVVVTPPGLGTWDLALYAAPFALIGFAWVVTAMRRR